MDLGGIRSTQDLLTPRSATGETRGNEELGKNAFLELMIAQFNNQDPLEPAKNEDFIAQLAQFSSLEGIQNLNAGVEAMASAMRASTTLQAAGLVGRSVLVPASQAFMAGEGLGGNIANGFPGSDITVQITDAAGGLVRKLHLGPHDTGEVQFTWDGASETGDPQAAGSYRFKAYAMVEGETTELEVELPELVTSVSFADGQASLNLKGGATVALSDVRKLQ